MSLSLLAFLVRKTSAAVSQTLSAARRASVQKANFHSHANIGPRCGLLLLTGLVMGCGGGSNTANSTRKQTGKLSVSVKWPDYQPSATSGGAAASKQAGASVHRIIPQNATRIVITIYNSADVNDSNALASAIITRQSPSYQFTLPVGTFRVNIREYDNDNPFAVAATTPDSEALAVNLLTINPGTEMPLTVAPQTTVKTLEITPAAASLTVGQPITVTATPYNSNHDMVPVPADTITFSPDSGANLISINPAQNPAVITGQLYGTAKVHATLQQTSDSAPILSLKATLDVHVNMAVTLDKSTIDARPTAAVTPQNQLALTATVQGENSQNHQGIVWYVFDSHGVTLDPGALTNESYTVNGNTTTYTATFTLPVSSVVSPDTGGVYQVMTISPTDGFSAGATFKVLSGHANINVN